MTAALYIPPTPPRPASPLPVRAFLRAVRTNALTVWPDRAYESDYTERHLLGRKTVLLNAPEAIHRVLVDNAANYRRTPASIRILRPIAGNGLLLSEGDAWRLQRRTIAPALTPRVLPMLARHVAAATRDALDALDARRDEPADLLAAMQGLALDIAGRSMFSMEMRRFGPAMRAMLAEYAADLSRPKLFDMLLPPSVPTLRDFARRRFSRRWMALIEATMADRLRAPPPDAPNDLFDLLRAARDPETGVGFSAEQLRDQVATMILAGHETTAVTLFWAATLLARVPAEQDAVARDETRCKAAIQETLRLFPPAFTLVRETIGADNVGGLTLRPGSVVMIAPWVLHRHRALWRDPDAFDPSRFMPGEPPPPRFAWMPFGAGPRVCVGAQFALMEAAMVLSALTERFTLSLIGDRPVLPVAVVTTQPDHPPLFQLRRRVG